MIESQSPPAPDMVVPVAVVHDLPQAAPMRNRAGRLMVLVFLLALFLPAYMLNGDPYWMPLFCRFMSLAIFALSVDLVWGYTGLLTLGHGVYFGLGVYAVGYSLKLREAAIAAAQATNTEPSFVPGPHMALIDFMDMARLPQVPVWIAPLINIWFAIAVAIVLPALVATLFGAAVFWRRIKGVYFSLITQAVLLATFTLIDCQLPYTGGRVGMTQLTELQLFGHKFPKESLGLLLLITGILVVAFLGCAWLVHSKFGKILTAIRDNEYRVMALGYNTAVYKTFLFALSAALAGLAGALYVSALGNAGPDSFGIVFSIKIVVMVAVGGRGTLVGAVLGALLVSIGEVYVNDMQPAAWPIIMGSLFIAVVLFMPDGIVGSLHKLSAKLSKLLAAK
jgi:urea transport system permease protein